MYGYIFDTEMNYLIIISRNLMEANLLLFILGIIVDFVEKNIEGRSNR